MALHYLMTQFYHQKNYFTVEGKFICWGGEVAINESLVCDGNNDCAITEHGVGSDETAYECA